MHNDLIPPDEIDKNQLDHVEWRAEYDVLTFLRRQKIIAEPCGVSSDLTEIRKKVEEFKPDIVFNLLEEFDGEAVFDQNVVSYLELLRLPYTGCNPRGLMIARDKALAKKIMSYHRIPVPRFRVFPRNQPRFSLGRPQFPMIVKCLNEEASLGLSRASIVTTEEKLIDRVKYVHEAFNVDAIAEEFIEGKEYYVGVIGNYRLKTFPVWELQFKEAKDPDKEFYSQNAKFNYKYRKRHGINTGPADISPELAKKMQSLARKTYRALSLNGYARIDFRVSVDGKIYVLEANPNPDVSEMDDFALSALKAKIKYKELLIKIIRLGKQWDPRQVVAAP